MELFSHCGKWRKLLSFLYAVLLFFLIASGFVYLYYFLHYGKELDEYIVLCILATTVSEMENYITALFSIPVLLGLCTLLSLAFFLLFRLLVKGSETSSLTIVPRKKIGVIFLLVSYFFINYSLSVFPADRMLHLYRKDGPLRAFVELRNNLPKNKKKFRGTSIELPTSKVVPGSILLVIGESANRDMMSAFAPTAVDTTPLEKAMRRNQNFFFYPYAYANFPNTVMALTSALSSANQYNGKPLRDAIDMLTVAKKAGYTTWWISTQEKSSVSDAGVTIIAEQADHTVWVDGYDEEVLQELAKIPAGENNFVVLHLMGSHFRYDHRVPDSFIQKQNWLPVDKGDKTQWYKRSLYYTDFVLSRIFQESQRLPLQAMVYFSDHGEDMKLTHTASPFLYNMVRVPLWIYLSSAYQQEYPLIIQQLRQHENVPFTNDLLFDTLSGILHMPSNFYDKRYDLTSDAYNLTWDTGLTLHGKKKIAEDTEQVRSK